MPMLSTVLTGSTGIPPRLKLVQYYTGCKYCLASNFSTWEVHIHNMNFSNMLSKLLEFILDNLVIIILFFRTLNFSNADS